MKRGARTILTVSAAGISVLGLASALTFPPKLVWNGSASAPLGLYWIDDRAPALGEFVLVAPTGKLEKFITERGYLPADIPLLKRVAALPGDEVCRESGAIFINETFVAEAQKMDSLGRDLPRWSGCFTLQNDAIFLLNDHERSLDGRYFGATKAQDVIGVAKPLRIMRTER